MITVPGMRETSDGFGGGREGELSRTDNPTRVGVLGSPGASGPRYLLI